MGESSTIRRTLIGSVAVAVAAPLMAVLATPAAPAFAVTGPHRESAIWTGDPMATVKTVTVTCPGEEHVLSPGGRVINGGGDVFLTGIVPNEAAKTVQVTAKLRPLAPARSWGLVAHAICATTDGVPVREEASSSTTLTAAAECTGDHRVYGTGFRLETAPASGPPVAVITQVEPNADLTRVRATAVRRTPGALQVHAFAICHPVVGMMAVRGQSSEPLDGSWPKVAVVTPDFENYRVYGVGGRVDTVLTDVHLDGLVPDPAANEARAYANRVPPAAGPLLAGGASVMVDPGSVVASEVEIGTFCVAPTN